MNKRSKSFLLSILTLSFIFYSCSNLANDLQKRKNQNLFNITIQETSNGTVTAAKSSGIKAGEEVILSVTATSGYELKTISVTNTQNKDVAVAAMEQGISYKFTMPASDVTVGAAFDKTVPVEITKPEDVTEPEDLNEVNGNTLYRIEHYKQNLDDTSTYTLCEIQKKVGDAGSDTAAVPQTFPGYEVVNFTQKKIASDGSTIVEIYYNRKTITYTIVPTGGYWEGSEQVYELTGLYYDPVLYQRYKMNGYTLYIDASIPDKFGIENMTFSAHWYPNADTEYTVNIYLESTSGNNNFTLQQTVIRKGTTDTNTNYSDNIYGFDLQPVEQQNINGDGSTVLNAYYKRRSYTVSFITNGGTEIPDQHVLYEACLPQIIATTKDGYTFYHWYYENTFNTVFDPNRVITEDITLYALWMFDSFNYQFHETIERYSVGTSDEYVLFGDYPQNRIADGVTVDESITLLMGNMVIYGGDDGNLYAKVNGGYYKVEPIKWEIVSRDENNIAVLISEKIIIRKQYHIDSNGICYKNSSIRSFLNDEFLSQAFTEPAQELIRIKQIDSTIITGYQEDGVWYQMDESLNDYSADKVFLLSFSDVFSYYKDFGQESSPNIPIRKITTAYSMGGSPERVFWWWLRTVRFLDNKNTPLYIDNRGDVYWGGEYHQASSGVGGIVPAITVRLPEED